MGEETDNVVESTSKLQEKLKALTGVDILTDAGAYKDTYTILKEIGAVWQDLEELDRAAALELMAGKNRANTLSAILNNVKDLEDAYNDAIDAEGSAQRELDTYLNSIKGRIDLFNNSVQTMWMNTINSEAVKNIVNLGTGLVNIIDKLGLVKTLVVGIATYFMTFSKHKIDLASILGIHNLDDEFLKGFSVIGKQGLTGKIAQAFKPKEKNKIISEVLGDSRDIKLSVEDFASAIKDNINDYVTIDTSEIDSAIDSVQQKLIIARKQLNEIEDPKKVKSSRGNDWNFYKVFGSSSPAKDRDNYVAEKIQEIKTLENQLAELQQKRDDIVSSAVNNVATSMVTSIDNEKQAYQSMLSVLSEVQETKLYLGNEQDAAIKIDAISQAAKNGQIDLANYVSSLNDTDIALKAYVASVQDGNYSLAGFQQFITQHNASVQASGIAAKAAAIGHQLLNSALTMGISLLASFAIEGIIKGLDELIVTTEEAAEAAKEVIDTYTDAQKTMRSNAKTISEISSEYEELAKGVDKFGRNINLTTEEYKRYNNIVNQIADMFPQMILGYTAEGNAILSTKGNVDALTEAYKEQAKAAREAIILGGSDVFSASKANLEDYEEQVETYKVARAMAGGLSTKAASEKYGESLANKAIKILEQYGFESHIGSYASGDTYKSYGLKQKFDKATSSYVNDYTHEEYIAHAERLKKLNLGLNQVLSQQEVELNKINQVLQAYLENNDKYAEMSEEMQSAISSIVKSLDPADFNYDDSVMEAFILSNIINPIYNNQDDVQEALNTILTVDPTKMDYATYQTIISDFLAGIANFDPKFQNALKSAFNLNDSEYAIDQNHVKKILLENIPDIDNKIGSLSLSDLKIAGELDVPENSIKSWDDLLARIQAVKNATSDNIIPVKTYEVITENIEKYNEIFKQTSEITIDNTEVTQEYKDSLKELGISEEDLNEYFYENNELVVKNAKGLNDLVKSTKNNIAKNAQLAKSQARLQYYELYKELKDLTKGEKVNDAAIQSNIDSLYNQMNALEKVIAKYSVLEAKLLGTSNAYQKLEEAQAADEEMDYGSKAEEAVKLLGAAIKTRQLGTATAQAAMEALIPEGVFEGLETAEAKMRAAYNYFTTGPISKLFTVKFDDEGAIESAEMTESNLKNYINSSEVFNGTWDNFTLDPAIMSMEDFMAATNMTREMAFSFLTELEKYDISWLAGKFDTLMDQLMGGDLEYAIQKTLSELSDLEVKIAKGTITEDEASRYNTLNENLSILGNTVRNNIPAYNQGMETLNGLKDNLATYKEQLDAGEITEEQYKQKVAETTGQMNELAKAMQQIEPAELELQLALDDVTQEIEDFKKKNEQLLLKVNIQKDANGKNSYTLNNTDTILSSDEKKALDQYLGLLDEQYTITVLADENPEDATSELEKVQNAAEAVTTAIENIPDPEIDITDAVYAINELQQVIDGLTGGSVDIRANVVNPGGAPTSSAAGQGSFKGTAHVSGDWGLPTNEHNALVGELGTELIVDPHTGRYYTVGNNGAEFVDLKKDSIIFNHRQTEELLSKGHINSRGKAYAEGNVKVSGPAHALTIGTTVEEDNKLKTEIRKQAKQSAALASAISAVQAAVKSTTQTVSTAVSTVTAGVDTYSGPTSLSGLKTGDSGDDSDKFEETIDWIEIRMEELDETLAKLNAELENLVGYAEQNNKIQEIINTNKKKLADSELGATEYMSEAQKYFDKIDPKYQNKAKDGAIDIDDFAGDADEKTVEAIQKYREYAQKAADLKRQVDEIKTEISNLAKQKFDNVATQYENEISLIENVNEQLDAQVSLMEDRGYVAATAYYEAMMNQATNRQEKLKAEKDALQDVLDAEVAAGNIKVNSDAWYEMVNAIYDVDAAIVECTSDLESFQNAINDIYWENFDELVNRLDYLKNETQNLIDLMDKDDMVITPETEDGWGADQVEWTKEGLASLGLYAQQMEIAEYQARQYAEAIKDLTADYQAGKYSESEYLAKLNELKDAQYDSIEAYYDAQDAIKDLNSTRIDAIKDGIEKEIKAYEKLIQKEKELLDAEKDAHDWEKSIQESEKDISTIKRKLMAIEGDTSIAATAKRKQLEAELAEAQYELEEKYLDRSYENKQNALDKELENFQEEKDAEVEKWEKYLEDIEIIISDSLNIVQANASGIYDTLGAKAEEYNLTVSDAVMSPWRDGALAVSDYQTAFDTAMSSTMDQLAALKQAWQDVIDKMEEAARDKMAEQKESNDDITDTPAPQTYTPTTTTTITPTAPPDYTVKDGDNLWNIAGAIYKDPTRWPEIYNLNRDIIGDDPNVIHAGQIFKMPAYAKGTVSLNKSGVVNIDELGDELVLRAVNGRLSYMEKGSGIIPADLTSNLMEWGALDPTEMLNQNRPVIGVHPEIHNTEVNISMDIAEVVHIDKVDNDTLPDLTKAVEKQLDKYMKNINNNIRKYTR